MNNSLKGLLALTLVGCCGDPPEIPSGAQVTRVDVNLSEWRGHSKAHFRLAKTQYGRLNKWLGTVEKSKNQKYLFMGSLVLEPTDGPPINVVIYSSGEKAIFEFNGNKCYYKAREGTAKQLHSFLIGHKAK